MRLLQVPLDTLFRTVGDWICGLPVEDVTISAPVPAPVIRFKSIYFAPVGVFQCKEGQAAVAICSENFAVDHYDQFFKGTFFRHWVERACVFEAFGRDVGLPDKFSNMMDQETSIYQAFSQLSLKAKQIIKTQDWPLRLFKRISTYSVTEQESCISAFSGWSLSRSEVIQAIEWVCDITDRDQIKMSQWLPDLSPNQAFSELLQKRFPSYAQKQRTFEQLRNSLPLEGWLLQPKQRYWDDGQFQLGTTLSSFTEARDQLKKLSILISSREFEKLCQLLDN